MEPNWHQSALASIVKGFLVQQISQEEFFSGIGWKLAGTVRLSRSVTPEG